MTTERPFFTVLVPTYQRGDLLPRAVASVLDQGFEDFELLVVDDASPDETAQVMAGTRDPRVRYLRRPENGGPAATRNTGLEAARGRWVALLDDDDEYLPGFLARTHEVLASAPPEVGLSWCGVRWVRDEGGERRVLREELWRPSYQDQEAAYRGFLRSRQIGTNCGLTLRADACQELGGFDESLRCAEDTDLLIRMVRRFDFRVVPHVLVEVHLHGGPNLRGVSLENARGYEAILDKHSAVLAADAGLAADFHYKTGWLWYRAGDRQRGRRHLLAALGRRPVHLRAWAALLLYESLGRKAATAHRALSRLRHGRAALADSRKS